jgi:hypothetical protein
VLSRGYGTGRDHHPATATTFLADGRRHGSIDLTTTVS